MNGLRVLSVVTGFLALAWLAACIADRVHPEPAAPESYYPAAGQVIKSRAEGFASQVIETDAERTWLELRLAPHAPGPPPHVHTGFAEFFHVEKKNLSLRVGDKVILLHTGEEFKVLPGVVHQPFNPTDEEVVVRGPLTADYALPRRFVLFLSQVYGYIDESPAHAKLPALALQMALFGPRYDIWLARPSPRVQRIQAAVLRPLARLLGYRCYYARFAPNRESSTESTSSAISMPVDLTSTNELVTKGDGNMTHTRDEEEIRELVATFIEGWNRADGKTCARPFAQHADFTAVTGQRVKGQELIAKAHDEILSTVFRGTHNSATVNDIDFLRPDVAAADVTFRIAPMPDKPWLPPYSTAGLIATKESGHWEIAVFRNMVPFGRPSAGPLDRELLHRRDEVLKGTHD